MAIPSPQRWQRLHAARRYAPLPRTTGAPQGLFHGPERMVPPPGACCCVWSEEVEHGYAASGDAGIVEISVPVDAVRALADELREGTAGVVAPEEIGDRVLYRNANS